MVDELADDRAPVVFKSPPTVKFPVVCAVADDIKPLVEISPVPVIEAQQVVSL